MVKDRIENLPVYYPLDERLKSLSERRTGKVKEYHSFSIDKECSNLFSVSKGAISAATGWRENRENREVTAAVRVEEGEFVLFLPSEPIAVKEDEGSEVEHWRLK